VWDWMRVWWRSGEVEVSRKTSGEGRRRERPFISPLFTHLTTHGLAGAVTHHFRPLICHLGAGCTQYKPVKAE